MKLCTISKAHRQNVMHSFEQRPNSCQKSFLKLTKHRHSNQERDCFFCALTESLCSLSSLLCPYDTLLPSEIGLLTICLYLISCLRTVRGYIHTHIESIPNCCITEISFMLQKIIITLSCHFRSFPFAFAL